MDDPDVQPELVVRSLGDVVRANRLFGGASAVVREIERVMRAEKSGAVLTLLDVGTGLGDIPSVARQASEKNGGKLEIIGLDASFASLRARLEPALAAVVGDALALPFADNSVDVVICSQVLHHFADADESRLIQEMNRVARVRVIVSDIRRSWLAAAGIWLASFPLRFHPVSRHDGVVSVLRGFTPSELKELVYSAAGVRPDVKSRRGFRVTASWIPTAESAHP